MRHSFDALKSDCIVSVEYDDITEEISIQMVKGARLVYGQVSLDTFNKFKAATSAGAFYNTHFRWGKHQFLGEV